MNRNPEPPKWSWYDTLFLIVCAIACMLIVPDAKADELRINYGVNTTHMDSEHYNETNHLVAIEYNNWLVATFQNSHYTQSYAVGGSYSLYTKSIFELDILGGVMYGYSPEQVPTCLENKLCLFVAPRLTANYKLNSDWSLNASTMLFGNAVITTVGVTWRF